MSQLTRSLEAAQQFCAEVAVRPSSLCPPRNACPGPCSAAAAGSLCWPGGECAAVQSGQREGSLTLGRMLTDAVASMPRLSPTAVGAAAGEDRQDHLLLLHLANLVHAHLALADQLGSSALPLL